MTEICAAASITRNDAWWRHIEKVKGQYDFSAYDNWVNTVKRSTGGACAAGSEPMLMHFILEVRPAPSSFHPATHY
jgi:hypothetical protein